MRSFYTTKVQLKYKAFGVEVLHPGIFLYHKGAIEIYVVESQPTGAVQAFYTTKVQLKLR